MTEDCHLMWALTFWPISLTSLQKAFFGISNTIFLIEPDFPKCFRSRSPLLDPCISYCFYVFHPASYWLIFSSLSGFSIFFGKLSSCNCQIPPPLLPALDTFHLQFFWGFHPLWIQPVLSTCPRCPGSLFHSNCFPCTSHQITEIDWINPFFFVTNFN